MPVHGPSGLGKRSTQYEESHTIPCLLYAFASLMLGGGKSRSVKLLLRVHSHDWILNVVAYIYPKTSSVEPFKDCTTLKGLYNGPYTILGSYQDMVYGSNFRYHSVLKHWPHLAAPLRHPGDRHGRRGEPLDTPKGSKYLRSTYIDPKVGI